MNKFRYISDLLFKFKFRYLVGVIFILAVDFLQLVLPRVLGMVTDALNSGGIERDTIVKYSLIVALIALGIGIFRFSWRYMVFGAARSIEATLRERFYAKLQSLSVNYYNNHKTGDLMAHATNDMENIRMLLGLGLTLSVDSLAIPVVAVTMMLLTVGWKLTLACFAPMILLAVYVAFITNTLHHRIQAMQEAFSMLTEKARENFSGIRVVKAFVQEAYEMESFRRASQHNKDTNLKYAGTFQLLFTIIITVSSLSFAIALLFGGIMIIRGDITLGDYVSFNSYLGLMIWPIASMGWLTSIFQRGLVSLERINFIMNQKPDIKDSANPVSIDKIQGELRFQQLSFQYPGTGSPVLKGLNIRVEAGKTLAIVGRTGSGKSTLINLIPRLYDAPEGTLFVDDIDIRQIPLEILRKGIGYVPQDTFLFSTSLKENIDFFGNHTDEEIVEAAKMARIYDNLMDFPDGLDTLVGERGVTLSGGQKQRIAIARALLTNPGILILDDSLSAVDTDTEEEILKGLRGKMKERTCILVSHRISTIKDADEIIVLEEGEIKERGTHQSLLALEGIYHDIYQKQLLADQIEEVE